MLRGPSGGGKKIQAFSNFKIGKTSLLNILGAIDLATSGEIYILNERIDEFSSDEFLASLRRKSIKYFKKFSF